LAGLATVWLIGWIIVGFESAAVNIAAFALGLVCGGAAIWLAWRGDRPTLQDSEALLDRTFTLS
jgi:hypothetical protein